MADDGRFADLSDENLQELLQNRDTKNAKNVIQASISILRVYCQAKYIDFDCLWSITKGKLGEFLFKFFAELRKKDGDKYSRSSTDVNANGTDEEPLPMVLIGNKVDLGAQRQVAFKTGQKLSDRNIMVGFTETSALTGENIQDIFYRLAYFITDTVNPELLYRTLPYGSRAKLTENPEHLQNRNYNTTSCGITAFKTEEVKKKERLCGCAIL